MGNASKKPLRKHPRERRDIHLNEIRHFARKHLAQRIMNARMVAADCEDAPTTQKIEIPGALTIPQILSLSAHEPYIVADRFQHAHHLLVHVARVKRLTVGLILSENGLDIGAHVLIS